MDYNLNTEIVDRRKIMESYFPEFLRSNKDFRVFVKLATEEMGTISDYIELFTSLVDIDNTPEQFIQDLGEMVGYSFIDNVDPEYQREMIKRVFNKHEARGDEKSLIMMAAHAQNLGYVGGDIFVPGTFLFGQEAVLTFPRDTLYTWNKSKRSGHDKYPDGLVAMDGVIEILIGYYDENIRSRTETVKPAGVKLYFKMMAALVGDSVVVKIQIPQIMTAVDLEIYRYISCHRVSKTWEHAWSGRTKQMRRSGQVRQELKFSPELNIFVSSLMTNNSIRELYYPQYSFEQIIAMYLAIPMQILKQFRGTPRYSVSFVWNGKYARSGLKTGQVDIDVQYQRSPSVRNPVVSTGDLRDVWVTGHNNYVQSEMEIIVERRVDNR